MKIGEASRLSGCHIETIRYYERVGILSPTVRSESGYRCYADHHIQQLRFILHARELGFSVDDIRELLSLKEQPDLSCQAVDSITDKHLHGIRNRIKYLESLARELRRISASCPGGDIAECRILEALGNSSD
ncbi:MAG: MerR family mercuric resistance operon transcriptional regulator [Halopseudomonas sp.]|jgi:MerR family mercuric resistance operon transcriptional regulator|uniref:MerR family transcriptional regulator n=1 Tax=Haliea salexigens TaxID=287487 RepID=UPI0004068B60|nr:helix-turn-helix domain-containing protein [Haliea salexigens]|tara:strand:+ start:1415 stop:1810 length:396 start_codon:yes stop_codon:yes gene_type:complete